LTQPAPPETSTIAAAISATIFDPLPERGDVDPPAVADAETVSPPTGLFTARQTARRMSQLATPQLATINPNTRTV